jgi:hypothetical protein
MTRRRETSEAPRGFSRDGTRPEQAAAGLTAIVDLKGTFDLSSDSTLAAAA